MASVSSPIGLYAQRGINLLQVGALRIPCFMASIASVTRVAEIALRLVSKALDFIGFNSKSDFSKWISTKVDYVRPYKDEQKFTTSTLLIEAVVLATIGIVGNAFVSALFGPPPAVYNTVLQWVGPVRVSSDNHPIIEIISQKYYS